MINIHNHDIVGVYSGSKDIVQVYSGLKLVWQKYKPKDDIILSCYYNGYWIDEYPWTDNTPWTD